jgi:hypothetical protein
MMNSGFVYVDHSLGMMRNGGVLIKDVSMFLKRISHYLRRAASKSTQAVAPAKVLKS